MFSSPSQSFGDVLFFIILYAGFFYIVSSKYITHTKLLDGTYQDYTNLKEYINQKEQITYLDKFVLILGPALFLSVLVLLTYVILEKFDYV